MEIKAENSLTKSLLQGKRILITGTTGFLGKVILEKIIRDIPEVAGINLLIRANKKYPSAEERFKSEILTSSIFDRLKESDPERLEMFCREKIQCISGEITEETFGMSSEAYAELSRTTDVFVNSAASVNFHEALDTALSINTLCLNNVVDFSSNAGDIPVVQVSTCYVNGFNSGTIAEDISQPRDNQIQKDSDGFYDIATVFNTLNAKIRHLKETIDDPEKREEALTELGLQEANRYGWGDTYTFTKWLGEQLLLKRLQDKTLTIVRPSVVESCWQSPKAGWIEGVKVTDAILLAYARGKVSLFPGRKAGIVDIIPVDLVANSVLLSIAEAFNEPGQTRIYQSCSGTQNPLGVAYYVSTICGEVKNNWRKYPRLARQQPKKDFVLVNKSLFVGVIKAMKLLYTLSDRLRLRTQNNKSKGLKVVETTLKLTNIYSTYTSPDYVFNSDKLMALAEKMGETDKQLFPVDAAIVDWKKYFTEIHVAGLHKYGLEDRSTDTVESDSQDTSSESASIGKEAPEPV